MIKNILFLETTSSFGGSTISLYTLVKYLDKSKYHPIVITPKQNKDQDYFMQQPNIRGSDHIQMRIFMPWTHNKIFHFFNRFSHRIAVAGRYMFWTTIVTGYDIFRLYLIGKKYEIDCLHINNGYGSSLAPGIAAKLLGVPCVGHFRDITYPYGAMIEIPRKLIKYRIAVSECVKDQMHNSLNLKDKDIEVIWNGVDVETYDINSDDIKSDASDVRKKYCLDGKKVFGILARLIEWKGIKGFVKAADVVFKKVPNSKALIIGDGDEQYIIEIKKLIQSLGISDKIIFTGYQCDVAKFFSLIDVVVNASIRPEPLGRTIIEAMAMGKPVVANASGGPMVQIIDGVTGFLVTNGDTQQMGEAIVRLFENQLLYQKMSIAARERFEEYYRAEVYARKVESYYERKVFGEVLRGWTRNAG